MRSPTRSPDGDSTRVRELYATMDSSCIYLGAIVRARHSMNWVFVLNTKWGGGLIDSWGGSIGYRYGDQPDYTRRGNFTGYAEFQAWTGSAWAGNGIPLAASEFAESISLDSLQDGWVEGRIPRSSIGDPAAFGVQVYITGNQTSEATYDACPDDQNTTAGSAITTHLRHYAYAGVKALTAANLQFPYCRDSLAPGEGFWLKFPSADTLLIAGYPQDSDTVSVSVNTNWNPVGAGSTPVPRSVPSFKAPPELSCRQFSATTEVMFRRRSSSPAKGTG